jgi:hypothetical protein
LSTHANHWPTKNRKDAQTISGKHNASGTTKQNSSVTLIPKKFRCASVVTAAPQWLPCVDVNSPLCARWGIVGQEGGDALQERSRLQRFGVERLVAGGDDAIAILLTGVRGQRDGR